MPRDEDIQQTGHLLHGWKICFSSPGTPVELGHLQQAREFLDEIRQDVLGGTMGSDVEVIGLGHDGELEKQWLNMIRTRCI